MAFLVRTVLCFLDDTLGLLTNGVVCKWAGSDVGVGGALSKFSLSLSPLSVALSRLFGGTSKKQISKLYQLSCHYDTCG